MVLLRQSEEGGATSQPQRIVIGGNDHKQTGRLELTLFVQQQQRNYQIKGWIQLFHQAIPIMVMRVAKTRIVQ